MIDNLFCSDLFIINEARISGYIIILLSLFEILTLSKTLIIICFIFQGWYMIFKFWISITVSSNSIFTVFNLFTILYGKPDVWRCCQITFIFFCSRFFFIVTKLFSVNLIIFEYHKKYIPIVATKIRNIVITIFIPGALMFFLLLIIYFSVNYFFSNIDINLVVLWFFVSLILITFPPIFFI